MTGCSVARVCSFATLSAMPTRILNLPVFVFVPLVVATLVRPGAPGFGLAIAAALGAIALLWQRAHALQTFGVPLVGFAALAIAALPGLPPAVPSRARRGAEIAIALLLAAGIGSVVLWSARGLPRRLALNVADRSSDAALAAASRRPGLLAVAPGVERPQQMTRRPIVIDPQALDMVTYAPAALPAMVRAIEDLYGIPFESPRPEHRNLSMLPAAPVKEIWERRSTAEWASIAAEFGVTDVLVPASWRIRLPELARSRAFVLHSITEPAGSSP